MSIIDAFKQLEPSLNGKGWVIELFVVIFATAIIHYIEMFIYKKLKPKVAVTKTKWDNAILEAVYKPVGALIWLIGLSISFHVLETQANSEAIFSFISPIRVVAVIAIVVWFLVRLIREIEDILISSTPGKRTYDKTTVNALAQILRASVVVTASLVGLQTLGFHISGLLALGGVSGIVVGLAAKDLLANFFGGLMIYFDRPFNVGDWIRSPDRQIEGTVEYIGWRLCRIRTFDKRPLYVPNSLFSTISVENPSRMTNRRIYTNIGLRYDDAPKIRDILIDIETMLKEHPEIDTSQTLMVNLVEFGASALNFMIYTFTKTTNWVKYQAIQQDVFLKIIDIITAHGAQCAFPTTTLHVPNGIDMRNHTNAQYFAPEKV